MAHEHMSTNNFFQELVKLFEANSFQRHGSIFLSQKRLTHKTDPEVFTGRKNQFDTLEDLALESPAPVLVRVTNGASRKNIKAKVKLSTVVQPGDIETFYSRYAEVCRSGMVFLKKRDRSAQKKKAKKRRVAAESGKRV